MREVFGADTIDDVRTAVDALVGQWEVELAAAGGLTGISEKGAITFAEHLVTRSGELKAFSRHRLLAEICGDLIGPDVNLCWDQAVYKCPEKPRRFPWHQDNGYTFVEPQSNRSSA